MLRTAAYCWNVVTMLRVVHNIVFAVLHHALMITIKLHLLKMADNNTISRLLLLLILWWRRSQKLRRKMRVKDTFANHLKWWISLSITRIEAKRPTVSLALSQNDSRKFDIIVNLVRIYLSKRSYNSVVRAEISVAERLALTIGYMATGNYQVSLSFSFPVGKSTVSGILKETCEDLWHVLQPVYVKLLQMKRNG